MKNIATTKCEQTTPSSIIFMIEFHNKQTSYMYIIKRLVWHHLTEDLNLTVCQICLAKVLYSLLGVFFLFSGSLGKGLFSCGRLALKQETVEKGVTFKE